MGPRRGRTCPSRQAAAQSRDHHVQDRHSRELGGRLRAADSSLRVPINVTIGAASAGMRLLTLARTFQTSMVATSLRLAAIDTLPVIVACFSKNGRHWSIPAPHVPKRWFVVDSLSDDSFAHDLLVKGSLTAALRKQSGEVWFQNDDAESYELHEHSMPYRNGQVLVLLYLSSKMLEARFDPNIGRRFNSQGSYVAGRPPSKRW